ncbi:MAG TPA: hypothetical protein VGI06_18470 [Acidimicrobiales bacterium]|jgi:hypothetical protein
MRTNATEIDARIIRCGEVEAITWDDVHRRPHITGRRLQRRSEQVADARRLEQVFAKVGA